MNNKNKKRALIALSATLASTAMVATVSTASATEYTEYVVVKGDNLYRLAIKYNTTVDAITQANNISNRNLIYVNQKLSIPTNTNTGSSSGSSSSGSSSSTTGYHTVVAGDTLSALALKYGTTVSQLASWNNISNVNFIRTGWTLKVSASAASSGSGSSSSGTVGSNQYRVVAGDNLWTLAKRFGTTVEQLAAWNNISNVRLIFVGDILTVSQTSKNTAGAVIDEIVYPDAVEETTDATVEQLADSEEVTEEADTTVEESTEETTEEATTEEVTDVATEEVATEEVADVATEETATEEVADVATEEANATVEVEVEAEVETVVEVPTSEVTEAATVEYSYTEPTEEVEEVVAEVAPVTNYYTVADDASVFQLAALFNASVGDLIAWNNIEDTNNITAGTVLRISL